MPRLNSSDRVKRWIIMEYNWNTNYFDVINVSGSRVKVTIVYINNRGVLKSQQIAEGITQLTTENINRVALDGIDREMIHRSQSIQVEQPNGIEFLPEDWKHSFLRQIHTTNLRVTGYGMTPRARAQQEAVYYLSPGSGLPFYNRNRPRR